MGTRDAGGAVLVCGATREVLGVPAKQEDEYSRAELPVMLGRWEELP